MDGKSCLLRLFFFLRSAWISKKRRKWEKNSDSSMEQEDVLMTPHDATEQAYRNGYEAGYKAAKDEMVRCKDCKHQRNWRPMCYCTIWKTVHGMGEDGFCGYGIRKEEK
jgi:hypothetical protein